MKLGSTRFRVIASEQAPAQAPVLRQGLINKPEVAICTSSVKFLYHGKWDELVLIIVAIR